MYTIREAAEKTGFSAYTLRYYERQNILPPVARDASGNRMYSEDDLNLLETIRCLKNTGMHVNDIGTFIALCREGDSTLEQRRQVMLEHKAQVEERIAQMMHELEHIERKLDYYDRACQAAYAAPTVQPDRRRWCIVTAGMVHGDRRCGAPGRHAENYSGMPLRLRMDSPSIWMV